MKKAIIFDVDDTLIIWKKEFIGALKKVLTNMNYDFDDNKINEISDMIDDNEKYHNKLTRQELLNHINNNCNLDLPIEFIDKLIVEQGNMYYEDEKLVKVIKYLSGKYDLYVITNWFTYTQIKRLENMGIAKYFKKIIGADQNYIKPDKRSFDIILSEVPADNCISIGDTLENDVILPLSLGMDAYWKTNKKSNKYNTIESIEELMNIL